MKARGRMGPGCPLCEERMRWWGRLKIHRDFYHVDGSCRACLRAYELLLENGPRASYHRACLLGELEKAQGGSPPG